MTDTVSTDGNVTARLIDPHQISLEDGKTDFILRKLWLKMCEKEIKNESDSFIKETLRFLKRPLRDNPFRMRIEDKVKTIEEKLEEFTQTIPITIKHHVEKQTAAQFENFTKIIPTVYDHLGQLKKDFWAQFAFDVNRANEERVVQRRKSTSDDAD